MLIPAEMMLIPAEMMLIPVEMMLIPVELIHRCNALSKFEVTRSMRV